MLRSKRCWSGGAAMLLMLASAGAVQAGVFSAHETANGADSPFTTLTDDVPTPWEVLLTPMVTHPTAERKVWFAEPGLGNHRGYEFGHILKRGTFKEGRPYRIIWDQLAWAPAPYILWLNEGKVYATDDGTAGPEHQFFPEVGGLIPGFHRNNAEQSPFRPQVIPLPTAAAVWLLLFFLPGRRRKAMAAAAHA